MRDDAGGVFGDQKLPGIPADAQSTGSDPLGIANAVHNHDEVDLRLWDADGMHRMGNEIVGDGDDAVGIGRIHHGIAKRTAGGASFDAVHVAISVTAGRSDKCYVDMQFPAFNGPGATAVGPNDGGLGQFAGSHQLTELAPAARGFDGGDDSRLNKGQYRIVDIIEGAGR